MKLHIFIWEHTAFYCTSFFIFQIPCSIPDPRSAHRSTQVGCSSENWHRKAWKRSPCWFAWLVLWAPDTTRAVKQQQNVRADCLCLLIRQRHTAGGLCWVALVGYKVIFVVRYRYKAKSKYHIWNLGRSLALRFCLMDCEMPLDWGAVTLVCCYRLLVSMAPFILESFSHRNKQSLRLPPSLCTLEILPCLASRAACQYLALSSFLWLSYKTWKYELIKKMAGAVGTAVMTSLLWF